MHGPYAGPVRLDHRLPAAVPAGALPVAGNRLPQR